MSSFRIGNTGRGGQEHAQDHGRREQRGGARTVRPLGLREHHDRDVVLDLRVAVLRVLVAHVAEPRTDMRVRYDVDGELELRAVCFVQLNFDLVLLFILVSRVHWRTLAQDA